MSSAETVEVNKQKQHQKSSNKMRIVRLGASYINAVRLIYGSIFKPKQIGVRGLKITSGRLGPITITLHLKIKRR